MVVKARMHCLMCGRDTFTVVNSKSKGTITDISDFKEILDDKAVNGWTVHNCGEGKIGIMRLCGAELAEDGEKP